MRPNEADAYLALCEVLADARLSLYMTEICIVNPDNGLWNVLPEAQEVTVALKRKHAAGQWALERATRGTSGTSVGPSRLRYRTMGFGTCYQRHGGASVGPPLCAARTMGFGTCYQRHLISPSLTLGLLRTDNGLWNVLPEARIAPGITCMDLTAGQWALERATRGTTSTSTRTASSLLRTMGFGTCYQRHTPCTPPASHCAAADNGLWNVLPEAHELIHFNDELFSTDNGLWNVLPEARSEKFYSQNERRRRTMGFGTCYQRHSIWPEKKARGWSGQWALERATRGTTG